MTRPCDRLILAPSLLAADWSRVGEEASRAHAAGADWLHLDVMDGRFVDNISFGPQMVKTVRRAAPHGFFLDVHLMIHRADHFLTRFIEAGANNITVHVEAEYDASLEQTLARIRAAGLTCGIALHPDTPFEAAVPWLHLVDLVLVMTVVPGFGGQPFLHHTMPKLAAARDYREANGLSYHLEVDGGIYADTAKVSTDNGANVLVAGTYAFGAADMGAALEVLRSQE